MQKQAIEQDDIARIYNLGDDNPLTLQDFWDLLCEHWGYKRPWRLPIWTFYTASYFSELFALILHKYSPLTRDFIKIGMSSAVMDTQRIKKSLLSRLQFKNIYEGLQIV